MRTEEQVRRGGEEAAREPWENEDMVLEPHVPSEKMMFERLDPRRREYSQESGEIKNLR